METDNVAMTRYAGDMPRTKPAPKPLRAINQWVRDALDHAGISQSELARRLTARFRRVVDRSMVNKMTIGRDVTAEEVFAIAEATGFPAPNEMTGEDGVTLVPLVDWVSAGRLQELSSAEALAILKTTSLPPGDWIALRVEGDSMDRISPPDSVIFINRRDKRLVANACYVIDDGEGKATYKRFRPNPMRFEPVSTNKVHEPLFPENEPTIVGRARRTMLDL